MRTEEPRKRKSPRSNERLRTWDSRTDKVVNTNPKTSTRLSNPQRWKIFLGDDDNEVGTIERADGGTRLDYTGKSSLVATVACHWLVRESILWDIAKSSVPTINAIN